MQAIRKAGLSCFLQKKQCSQDFTIIFARKEIAPLQAPDAFDITQS